jgi:hypothetical protein
MGWYDYNMERADTRNIRFEINCDNFISKYIIFDRLCGLVVRVSSYRSRGPGFDSRPYQIFSENLNSRGSGTGSTQPRENN